MTTEIIYGSLAFISRDRNPSLEPATWPFRRVGADPALAVPAKPVSRLGASRCDPGEGGRRG